MKKFRSYREALNKFCYFKDGKYYSDEVCEREITYNIDVHFDWANSESFTGLTDKNGKEIYEGDILEERFIVCNMQDTGLIDGEYCSGHYVETKRYVANMNLDYENDLINVGFFDERCDKLLEEDELYNYPSGIYLIGNIHDNPELLNPQ